jgi:hypothetical protein
MGDEWDKNTPSLHAHTPVGNKSINTCPCQQANFMPTFTLAFIPALMQLAGWESYQHKT